MSHPKTSCRMCDWYIRAGGKQYSGPSGYGGCYRKKQPTHANQTACKDDFERGAPCSSITEAEFKKKLRVLYDAAKGCLQSGGWMPEFSALNSAVVEINFAFEWDREVLQCGCLPSNLCDCPENSDEL